MEELFDICSCNGIRSVIWCGGYTDTAPGGPGVSVNGPGVTVHGEHSGPGYMVSPLTGTGNTLMQSQSFDIIVVAPLSV